MKSQFESAEHQAIAQVKSELQEAARNHLNGIPHRAQNRLEELLAGPKNTRFNDFPKGGIVRLLTNSLTGWESKKIREMAGLQSK
ncbi:hypothetical protein H6768_04325 [Candidatus Peribacteria bacterium]|nr:hypothetical protein [Candidatus Peribacteria bacterium]